MAQTVVGLFDDPFAAQSAVDKLISGGFTREQIDLSISSNREKEKHRNEEESSITRFFKSLFGDNEKADRYASVGSRCSIVTVHAATTDEAPRAADLLDEYGAIDVNERSAQSFSANTSDRDNDRTNRMKIPTSNTYNNENVDMPTGGNNRSRSRIVDQPIGEHWRLRENNNRAEQNPMDGTTSEINLQSFQEGSFVLTEKKELSIAKKEARIVEEIRLYKEETEREQTIQENVRHTNVDVDRLEDDGLRNETFENNSEMDFDIKRGYRVESKNEQRNDEDEDWSRSKRG